MSSISTNKIYVLKNSFTAAAKILSLAGNGNSLAMVDAHNVTSNGLWFLTPTTSARYYRLHTLANGVKQALDVVNDNGVLKRARIIAKLLLTTVTRAWRAHQIFAVPML
ncbi:hypothetical protein TrVGV298_012011 [Trichoderma virens]|nr:hypothetical protein TrVGV298_012011 [Trichoderma virens]